MAGTRLLSLLLTKLVLDAGTQIRFELDVETAEEYADALRAGARFPAAVVYQEGKRYVLADGFHRAEAHRLAGQKYIQCEVRDGTQRDAVLFAVGANASHGRQRTIKDRRKAVLTLLVDPEWSLWSNRRIAAQCGRVSEHLVRTVRDELSATRSQLREQTERKVQRGGTFYTMQTAGLAGSAQRATPPSPPTGAAPQGYLGPGRAKPDPNEPLVLAVHALEEACNVSTRLRSVLLEVAGELERFGTAAGALSRARKALAAADGLPGLCKAAHGAANGLLGGKS